ncbi:MAG: hypothetical protein Q9N02_08265 [Ghiorsea sp.]|nr:hypothetical protein [Ghiorsea sp.]
MILASKKVVLAKIEAVYNTNSAPTGAANAVLARNFTLTPLEGTTATRSHVRAQMGGFEDTPMTGLNASLEFDVDLTGAGKPGALPPYHALMRACAFAPTVAAGVSVIYKPAPALFESMSMICFRDGVRHLVTGCRGDWSYKMSALGELLLHFKMQGNYQPVTDVPIPAATLPVVTPIPCDAANIPSFSLHGYSALLQSLDLAGGHDLQYRNLINSGGEVQIVGRDITGTVVVEEPAVATFDYWNAAIKGAKGAMSITHGTVAGNIVQMTAPNVQIGKISLSENNGVSFVSIPVKCLPKLGNDDITLTVR